MSSTETATRSYRSELRERQAAETRLRIIAAAAELFSELGYAGTTLAKVAKRAHVSVETVQKSGPKSALIRAAVEVTSFGVEGDRDVRELEAGKAFLTLTDPEQFPPLAAATMRAVNSGSAGPWMALAGAAHSDPELRAAHVEFLRAIRRQNERVLGLFRDRGWLRDDLPFDEIVDRWTVLSSVDTYHRLTAYEGRTLDEYTAWLERMVADTMMAR
ncbi:TetR/AcrR family transcriptional regulator [Agromyces aurantiacus]|uniref:TetR/AcrR family transcriptional regulator n=1 Tax=Agromyces aurantiacus TaxID=165814 RepID=A0ABV9R9X8_9MICO|nr:TetR/AcrR family transcriptional regulator [Agromyces aurantiacus]MBM7503799.1 AcrR family transcriptional regulator [Agromyces aurantiacus]